MKKTASTHEAPQVRGIHAIVNGMVQGVYFRQFTKDQATALGITGWVRNLPNGCVELKAFGPDSALNTLVEKLHQGPAAARVAELSVTDIPLEIFNTFNINR